MAGRFFGGRGECRVWRRSELPGSFGKKPFCGLEPWNRAAVPLAQVQKKGQQLQGEGEGVDPGTKVSKVWGRRLRLTMSPILGALEYAIVLRFVPMGASSSAGRRVSSNIVWMSILEGSCRWNGRWMKKVSSLLYWIPSGPSRRTGMDKVAT